MNDMLEKSIKEQLDAQRMAYEQAGVLQKLSSGMMGIKGIDGKEYPFPTIEDVMARGKDKMDLLQKKAQQGFTKLLVVPFAMPLKELMEKYKMLCLDLYKKKGKFFAPKKNAGDADEMLEYAGEADPFYAWEEYFEGDKTGNIVYMQKKLAAEGHGGMTKMQLLDMGKDMKGAGWDMVMLEDMANIPRKGMGKEVGGRKQFETTMTPGWYLEQLMTNPMYAGESGMSPEDFLANALVTLATTHSVLNDWQGHGGVEYLIGALFVKQMKVGTACWRRAYKRTGMAALGPDVVDDYYAIRPVVRV